MATTWVTTCDGPGCSNRYASPATGHELGWLSVCGNGTRKSGEFCGFRCLGAWAEQRRLASDPFSPKRDDGG